MYFINFNLFVICLVELVAQKCQTQGPCRQIFLSCEKSEIQNYVISCQEVLCQLENQTQRKNHHRKSQLEPTGYAQCTDHQQWW